MTGLWQSKKKKAGTREGAGLFRSFEKELSADSAYGTGIHACTAINAGVGRNVSFAAVFTDGVYRAGIVACTAVDAFIRNLVSQGIHLLRHNFGLVV